ncbi:MAG: SPOR domain-containing protein [Flavobacteriaceae bacterium]|nr:SPOR domain-containing protein [Flavobacteriaceae bacterium]
MPVLTEEELNELKTKIATSEENLANSITQKNKAQKKAEDAQKQKSVFMILSVLFFVLLIGTYALLYTQPELLAVDTGTSLAEDEMVVKKEEVNQYQSTITSLEQELQQIKSRGTHPLDLNEFYAVQLGAFKKFDTRLSSASFSIVRNANFNDFNLFTLGVFETKEEAEKLKNVVRQLNFRDAFVGQYKNGERINSKF